MRIKFNLWMSFFVSMFLLACTNKHDAWYDNIKTSLEKRINIKADSTRTTYGEDSVLIVHYFFHGNEYKSELFARNVFEESRPYFLYEESIYNSDKTFELRKVKWGDGSIGRENILYKGFRYGPFKSYHPDGKLYLRGMQYKDQLVGTLEYWNEDGTFKQKEDYGEPEKMDSILLIQYIE